MGGGRGGEKGDQKTRLTVGGGSQARRIWPVVEQKSEEIPPLRLRQEGRRWMAAAMPIYSYYFPSTTTINSLQFVYISSTFHPTIAPPSRAAKRRALYRHGGWQSRVVSQNREAGGNAINEKTKPTYQSSVKGTNNQTQLSASIAANIVVVYMSRGREIRRREGKEKNHLQNTARAQRLPTGPESFKEAI